MEVIEKFINKELKDFDNFKYKIEEENSYIYIQFSMIFGENSSKEITFKIIENELYIHSTSFGWKAILKPSMNKYLWIELLK